MPLILQDDQQVPYAAAFVDKKGMPAVVDGVPVWAISDPTLASVTPAADGLSALVVATAVTPPGSTVQVSCTADARMGPDVVPLVLTDDITIVAGEAVSGTLSAGTPVAQP